MLSEAQHGYTAIPRQLRLLTVDAFQVQVENGLENIFLGFFAGFNLGLTCIAVVRTTLVTMQLFNSSIRKNLFQIV